MYAIALGRWNMSVGRWFVCKRIYLKGWRWTPFVKIEKRKPHPYLSQILLDEMRKFRDIQGDNGSWNYDPYMHGMYNGMEFMLAMAENREPEFREAPSEWLSDRKVTGDVEVAG